MALLDLLSVFHSDFKLAFAILALAAYENAGTIGLLAVAFRHFITAVGTNDFHIIFFNGPPPPFACATPQRLQSDPRRAALPVSLVRRARAAQGA